jgi:DNA mismatch repair protein MutL
VRDSLRTALIKARPAAGFLAALDGAPLASPSLMPPATSPLPGSPGERPAPMLPDSDADAYQSAAADAEPFQLVPPAETLVPGNLPFSPANFRSSGFSDRGAWGEAAAALFTPAVLPAPNGCSPNNGKPETYAESALATAEVEAEQAAGTLNHLASLKPLGQLRDSFILAVGAEGLWIIDQHVAHERVLFEKILRERTVEKVQRQRLLMPLLVELKPWQMVTFAQIAGELERNGFEVEPFGPQTLAVKAAPVGLDGAALERLLTEVIEQGGDADSGESSQLEQNENLKSLRTRIAASIACHAAIKVNTPLDPERMLWLLLELARTEHPTSCPHGRPIALLYSWKEIQRAFHRI